MNLSLTKYDSGSVVERMSEKEAEAWSIEREQGQFRWILKRSLVYGIIGFSIWGLVFWLLELSSRLSLFWLMFYIAVEIGTFYALWDQKEQKYWQHTIDESLTEPPKESFLNFED